MGRNRRTHKRQKLKPVPPQIPQPFPAGKISQDMVLSEEDETIRKLIRKYGQNWKLVPEILNSKNGKQIRERFINKLDPRIKKDDWSEEEDRKIL